MGGMLVNQKDMSQINETGWNRHAYDAWVNRHGVPAEYAEKIKHKPLKSVEYYLNYMNGIKGRKIVNLLGSKGNKAVSFALLGADVTVVDLSKDNARYASELAAAAGVEVTYIISDVLNIPEPQTISDADYILLELGVLHYFLDLDPLFELIHEGLKKGGRFILRDYHPMVSKVLRAKDGMMAVEGDYFDRDMKEVDVAYSIHLPEEQKKSLPKNTIRRWTLGEVITSLVRAGLTIQHLEEEAGIRWAFPEGTPEGFEEKMPGLFTLIADKK